MSLKDTENAIILRLQAQVTTVPTEGFPEKPEQYQLKHKSGVLLVSYAGSKYSQPSQGNAVVQDRRQEWDIVLVFRNLREHTGAYDILDSVRSALTGYVLSAEYTGMYPVREEFISEVSGIWQYGITFAFHATHIQS